jgi:hypothetical protein
MTCSRDRPTLSGTAWDRTRGRGKDPGRYACTELERHLGTALHGSYPEAYSACHAAFAACPRGSDPGRAYPTHEQSRLPQAAVTSASWRSVTVTPGGLPLPGAME